MIITMHDLHGCVSKERSLDALAMATLSYADAVETKMSPLRWYDGDSLVDDLCKGAGSHVDERKGNLQRFCSGVVSWPGSRGNSDDEDDDQSEDSNAWWRPPRLNHAYALPKRPEHFQTMLLCCPACYLQQVRAFRRWDMEHHRMKAKVTKSHC